ncbi:RecX family transcriptional regulator [Marivirga sp. S37H4]|uniref:Regulatory protein RecX n=1 Tax=Marivirga aurantiaca TaxID=2802615 RepID=A0A934X271_9BACT|nr:RecX family transcriptional regulator [Marivirga aurantiaca]MBK6267111.1 RecX family transcriptional regulator [Marivirga aurantiaca]
MSAKKVYTIKEGKTKAMKFCAYQERTQQQVRDKLYDWGLYGDEVEEVIGYLITENFLNEERFAKTYASGHFRMKKWGRIKIKQGLEQKKLSTYCIKKGLEEIDSVEYQETLNELLSKKYQSIRDSNLYIRKQKAVKYLLQKGYEADLVWAATEEL